MKKEEVLAHAILEHVGGKDNLRQLAHCMTRVRLSLKDPTQADIDALKQIDGVMGSSMTRRYNRRRSGNGQSGSRPLKS